MPGYGSRCELVLLKKKNIGIQGSLRYPARLLNPLLLQKALKLLQISFIGKLRVLRRLLHIMKINNKLPYLFFHAPMPSCFVVYVNQKRFKTHYNQFFEEKQCAFLPILRGFLQQFA